MRIESVSLSLTRSVASLERIGTYAAPGGEKIDLLVVRLTGESKLARARTALRNYAADYLKTR